VFPALIVHSELKSVHPGFPRNHENTMPETAFLGAQIAPKSFSAAIGQHLLPAGHSAANSPAAVAAVDRWYRQTDRRTPDRYIELAPHTVRAASTE